MSALANKTILFSGVFPGHDRKDLEAQATAAGAKLLSGVSKNLQYLVAGAKMGPDKKKKAEELAVPIISLEEFFAMIGIVVEKLDYIKLLGPDAGLLKELDRPGIALYRKSIDTNVDHTAMQSLLKQHSLRLDEGVKEFYSQVREVDIYWELDGKNPPKLERAWCDTGDDPVEYLYGQINISSLDSLIMADYDSMFALGEMDRETKNEFKKYRRFDQSISECMTLLKVDRGRLEDKIYLWYYRNSYTIETELNIAQYIALVCMTKGFGGWQYPLTIAEEINNEMLQCYLPQLFPDQTFDFSAFPPLRKPEDRY